MIVQVRRQWRVASLLGMATAILAPFGTTPARAQAPTVDFSVTKLGTPDLVVPGDNITYTIKVINNSQVAFPFFRMTDVVPTGTTFLSIDAPCSTPPVGDTGTVTCEFAMGGPFALFTLVVKVNPDICALQTQVTNVATVTATEGFLDPDPSNNTSPAVITSVRCGYPLAVSPAAPSAAPLAAAAGPFQSSGGESRPWRPYVVFVAAAGFIALEAGLARRQRRGPTP
jgi:uncharacterized repeat protein (TIGR01451 family)